MRADEAERWLLAAGDLIAFALIALGLVLTLVLGGGDVVA